MTFEEAKRIALQLMCSEECGRYLDDLDLDKIYRAAFRHPKFRGAGDNCVLSITWALLQLGLSPVGILSRCNNRTHAGQFVGLDEIKGHLTIPDNITILQERTFKDCNKLISVDCNKVKKVYNDVFLSCQSLEEIKFDKDIELIHVSSFGFTYGATLVFDLTYQQILDQVRFEGLARRLITCGDTNTKIKTLDKEGPITFKKGEEGQLIPTIRGV